LRLLTVNADDFGFTHDVNSGIVEAHQKGILTATTLMANGAAFDDAIRWARENPELSVGCHLVLVGGASLLTGRDYPLTVAQLIRAILARSLDPYAELRAQIKRIVEAGIRPWHLDTHKHTHLFPAVLEAVARLSEEFEIPFVRRPFDFPLRPGRAPFSKRLLTRAFGVVRPRFESTFRRRGCRTTDWFAGFGITGAFTSADLVDMIATLPEGSTEFMCHPGHCGPELQAARTRLKQSRQQELTALLAPEVRQALDRHGVRLVNYAHLAQA
jgi:predicted glycoside hydrolase/deacetylase ChbG (UPF0249 family)